MGFWALVSSLWVCMPRVQLGLLSFQTCVLHVQNDKFYMYRMNYEIFFALFFLSLNQTNPFSYPLLL